MSGPSSSASEAGLGPRPCDCERCDCGNIGDAQEVARWDERAAMLSASSSDIERLRADLARERDKLASMNLDRDERWRRQQAAEARAASAEREKEAALGLVQGHAAIIATLEATLAVMDAALEPFSKVADAFKPAMPDDERRWPGHIPLPTVGDLRRAREARTRAHGGKDG